MIALIQRVKWAKVEVESQTVGEIAHGLLVLLGVEQGDTQVGFFLCIALLHT